jgi:transcriptional regulator with XRE-family HTH domain
VPHRPHRAAQNAPSPPPEAKILGRRIQSLRQARGLTQEDLADAADLDRSYIAGVEGGFRNPALRNLLRIARALKVTLSELVQGL